MTTQLVLTPIGPVTGDIDLTAAGDIVLNAGGTEQLRFTSTGLMERKNSVLVTESGHASADIPVGTVSFKVDTYDNLILGNNKLLTGTTGGLLANGVIPTGLMYQQESHDLFVGGGIFAASVGDPPDIGLVRLGPDNTWPDNGGLGVAGIPNGSSLGKIAWYGAATPDGGTPDVTLGATVQSASAVIYAKAAEDNVKSGSNYHQGGELWFQTTPNGTSSPVDVLGLQNTGTMVFKGGALRIANATGVISADSATSATNIFLKAEVAGDANVRFQIRQSGTIEWGSGSGATDAVLARTAAAALSLTGSLTASGPLSTTGLTGAVAASRYVGATASGAPASGTFAVGDFVIGQDGSLWICTTAGTPGTWAQPAAGSLASGALTDAMVNASAAIALSKLADPGAGKVLTSAGSGAIAAYPPGYEIAYAQITSNVSVTGTTAASPTDIGLSSGAITYDGSAVWIEFFSPQMSRGSSSITAVLYDGSTQMMNLGQDTAAPDHGGPYRVRVTPSAGSHTYKIMAYVDAGTGTVHADNGAAGNFAPAYIRVTKA